MPCLDAMDEWLGADREAYYWQWLLLGMEKSNQSIEFLSMNACILPFL